MIRRWASIPSVGTAAVVSVLGAALAVGLVLSTLNARAAAGISGARRAISVAEAAIVAPQTCAPGNPAARIKTVILPGKCWLDGKGVDVYGDGPSYSGPYQCVELIVRLYKTRKWIRTPWPYANGDQMWDTHPGNLKDQKQGKITYLGPGDAVSMDVNYKGQPDPAYAGEGHVSVVDTVSLAGKGLYSLKLVNQNAASVYTTGTWNAHTGTVTLTRSGYYSYPVLGVVHAPTSKPLTTSPTPSPSPKPSPTPTEPQSAQPSGSLFDIASVATNNAWTVGYSYSSSSGRTDALIEHWNGTSWRQVTGAVLGADSILQDVSAISSNQIWAVGELDSTSAWQGLIEYWNGTTWKRVDSPSPANTAFAAVAAASPTSAWAVGTQNANQEPQQEPVIEHWNGNVWRQAASADPAAGGDLYGVTAISANDAWAVGNTASDKPLIEHWDGSSWTRVTSPVFTDDSYLYGVMATSPSSVWAVGETSGQALIEHWNGSTWTTVKAPQDSLGSSLSDITMTSPDNGWAVGTTNPLGDGGVNLIEHWDGTSWKLVRTPNPTVGPNFLGGVAATSANNAFAVGATSIEGNSQTAFIIRWNGATWK